MSAKNPLPLVRSGQGDESPNFIEEAERINLVEFIDSVFRELLRIPWPTNFALPKDALSEADYQT